MQSLVGIGRSLGANIGYVRQLWLVDFRDVLSLSDPHKSPALATLSGGYRLPAQALQLIETATVVEVKFVHDSSIYTETHSETPMGDQYAISVQVAVPKDGPMTALAISRFSGRRFIAVVVDGNGQQKVLGSLRQPLRFSTTLDSAAAHRLLVFSTVTGRPSWFSQENMTSYVSPDAEFTYGFSLDFNS